MKLSFRVGNRTWWVVESHQSPSELFRKSTFFEESRHICSFSYPEIDMTSILGSFPASFLEAHQSGSEPGLQLLPYRLNFRCHFQKPWWSYWCLLCFNNWCGKKVQINQTKTRVTRLRWEQMSRWMPQLWIWLQRARTSILMLSYWKEI